MMSCQYKMVTAICCCSAARLDLQAMGMGGTGALVHPDDLSEVVHAHGGADVHGEGAAAVAALFVRHLPVLRICVLLIPFAPLASVLPLSHQHTCSARQHGILCRNLVLFPLICGPRLL